MFKNLVVSGCSLTWGEELYNVEYRWSKILASKLDNAKLWDFSLVGVSNEIISQNLINGLLCLQRNCTPDNTLVVVQWTFMTRLNYIGKNEKFYTLANHNMDPYMRRFKVEMGHSNVYFNDDFEDVYDLQRYFNHHTNSYFFMTYNMIKLIHHTQTFLKSKGYKYIFLFGALEEQKALNIKADIFDVEYEFKNDIIPPFHFMVGDIDKTNLFDVPFHEFTIKNGYPVGPMNHPLEKAHIEYGKLLHEYVKEKYNV